MSDCKHELARYGLAECCRHCRETAGDIIASLQAELAQARDMVVQYTSREIALREKLATTQDRLKERWLDTINLSTQVRQATAEAAVLKEAATAYRQGIEAWYQRWVTTLPEDATVDEVLAWVRPLEETGQELNDLEKHLDAALASTPLAEAMLRRLEVAERVADADIAYEHQLNHPWELLDDWAARLDELAGAQEAAWAGWRKAKEEA